MYQNYEAVSGEFPQGDGLANVTLRLNPILDTVESVLTLFESLSTGEDNIASRLSLVVDAVHAKVHRHAR